MFVWVRRLSLVSAHSAIRHIYPLATVSLDNTHHGISDSMTLYRCGAMRWVAAPRAGGRVLATSLERMGTMSSGIRA